MTLGVAAVVAIAFSVAVATPAQAAGICPGATWSVSLKMGQTSSDVMKLQQFLNMDPDTRIASAGVGSAGLETSYFGGLTKAAVNKFQAKYAAQILTPNGLTTPTGLFGPSSRAQANGLCSGSTSTNTTPTVPVTGNGLRVVLSPDSPNNVALVQGQAAGLLAKYTFVNPTNASIMVTNISFKRIGVSNDTTMVNVYLYNGAVRITDSAGVSNSAFAFNNPSGLFTVPAGSTYTISVASDIAGSTSGQQIGVQLVSVGATGTLDTGTSFPINSFTQTISAATLATADFNATTLPAGGAIDPQADATVWQNTLTVNTRSVYLKTFALRNTGSIQNADVRNFRLFIDGVQAGNAVASLDANNIVTFDLSANPVTLQTGGRVIKVLADIVGGASRTFDFSLRYPGDALMIDSNLGQGILSTANGSTFSSRNGGGTSGNSGAGVVSTINSISNSAPSVTRSATSPTQNVSVGATSVKWATFKLLASGEDVKIDNLNVLVDTSIHNGGLQNGSVFFNGIQVGSTKNLYNGTIETGDTNFTFGSSMILKAGTVAVVDIYADAKTSTSTNLSSGETVLISLDTGSQNGQGQISLNSVNIPTAAVQGNTITVASAALTATKYSGYGNQTMIAGSQNAKIGSLTLSTGATEGVNVNTISITFAQAVSGTISDLTLKDHDTQAVMGTSKSTISTTNDFAVNLSLPASGTKTIDVYANIKSNAIAGTIGGTGTTNVQVGTNTTGTGAVTGTSITVSPAATLQSIVIGPALLTVATDNGNTPDNTNVIAGSNMVKVGSFRFTSQYSPYTVDKVMVEIPSGAATSVGSVIVKYKDINGADQSSTQSLTLPSTTQGAATSTFSGLTFYVPQNDSRSLDVYVSIPTIASGASTGAGITSQLVYNLGFNATDSAGNASTTVGSANYTSVSTGKGTMYVRKSIPTLSGVALDTTAFTSGSNVPIARMKVTADAAGDIGWGKVAFAINKTSTVTFGATSTMTVWSGGTQVQGTFSTTTAGIGSDLFAVSATAGTLIFVPNNEEQISAGSSKTYELRAGTLATTGTSGQQFVTVNIPQTSTSAATAAFATIHTAVTDASESLTWSDRSSISPVHSNGSTSLDWANDYLLKTLPTALGTLSSNF
jgi:hypothetical protein